MAVEYIDYAKMVAERQQAQTQAEKGQFDLEAEKKAYANKQASMKDISGLLKGYAEEDANAPKTPPQKIDAGPGGYDPSTGTTGEDRQQDANFKEQMAAQQMQGQSIQKQAQRLNQMMLAAAKNTDPETALKFRAELDGLDDKFRKNQTDTLTLSGKLYEVGGQLANAYLANQTPENWYNTAKEAMSLGIPGSEAMLQVPLNKRADFANAYAMRARTAQQELAGQLKIAGMKLKEDALKEATRYHDGTLAVRNRAINDARNYRSASLSFQQNKQTAAEKNKQIDAAEKVVKSHQGLVNYLEDESRGLESQLSKLDKSLAPEEDVAAAKAVIQRKLDTNQTELDDAKSELNRYSKELDDVAHSGDKKEETKATAKPAGKAVSITSKTEYDKLKDGDKYIWNGVEHTKGKK